MKNLQQMKKSTQKGFTLIELMIVVAIIGILAAVAIPQYREYTRNATAQSTITEAGAYKLAVSLCIQTNGGVAAGCDAGGNRIPAATGIVTGVTDGVIAITLGDIDGDGTDETVINTPVPTDTLVTWTITSAGGTDVCASGWVDCTSI